MTKHGAREHPECVGRHVVAGRWLALSGDGTLRPWLFRALHPALSHVTLAQRTVWSLAQAREALERLIGQCEDWARLDEYLISFVVEPSQARTVFASSFASTLELVREGRMEVHQQTAFAPIFVRKSRTSGDDGADAGGRVAPAQTTGMKG